MMRTPPPTNASYLPSVSEGLEPPRSAAPPAWPALFPRSCSGSRGSFAALLRAVAAPRRRRARPRPPAAGWRRSNRRTTTFAELGAVREQVLHQLGRRTELGRAKAPRRCGAASPRAFSSTGGARHKRPRGLARRSEGLSYDTRRPLRRLVGRGPQPDRHDRGPKCSCARPPRLPLLLAAGDAVRCPARDEGLKPGAWTVYNDGMAREPGSAGCPELSPARAAALAARRHDGSSSRRRKAQAGIGERRGGGSGSTSEVHKDAMEGLRPAYPPATPERSRARPLHASRLPTPIFPAADRCCSELLLRADPRQCRAAGRHSGLQHFHQDPGRPSNGLRRLRPPVDGSPTRLCRPAGTPLRPCLRRVTGGFRHR